MTSCHNFGKVAEYCRRYFVVVIRVAVYSLHSWKLILTADVVQSVHGENPPPQKIATKGFSIDSVGF